MVTSKSKPKAASASTTPSRPARSAPRRASSRSVGVLDQRALDDAVAKAIAPLAQRFEDLEASIRQLPSLLPGTSGADELERIRAAMTAIAAAMAEPRRHWWQRRDSNALEPDRVRRAIEAAGES